MKKFESLLIVFVLIFIGFEILINSNLILDSVRYSLTIFKENVFPSLFPFFILSSLLINYGFPEFMGNIFNGLMHKLFKISGTCSFIFFMSIISGNPASAKYTKDLYIDGKINKFEATKILCFSCFTSPLFILGTVSVFLNNKEVPLLILICHYISNLIVGIIIRFYHPSKYDRSSLKKAVNDMHMKRISNKDSFGVIITNSLTNSINTLLMILGSITVCLVITTIINNNLNLNSTIQSLFNGVVEITQGLKYIGLEAIPLKLKCVLTVMIISFGGISVHLQIMGILSDTDIKYLPFLCSRVFCSLCSGLLVYFLFDFWINF